MMTDRDQKFYTKLFICLLALAIGVRCYLWFAEVELEIPIVDTVLKTTWSVLGAALTAFSKYISPT